MASDVSAHGDLRDSAHGFGLLRYSLVLAITLFAALVTNAAREVQRSLADLVRLGAIAWVTRNVALPFVV